MARFVQKGEKRRKNERKAGRRKTSSSRRRKLKGPKWKGRMKGVRRKQARPKCGPRLGRPLISNLSGIRLQPFMLRP